MTRICLPSTLNSTLRSRIGASACRTRTQVATIQRQIRKSPLSCAVRRYCPFNPMAATPLPCPSRTRSSFPVITSCTSRLFLEPKAPDMPYRPHSETVMQRTPPWWRASMWTGSPAKRLVRLLVSREIGSRSTEPLKVLSLPAMRMPSPPGIKTAVRTPRTKGAFTMASGLRRLTEPPSSVADPSLSTSSTCPASVRARQMSRSHSMTRPFCLTAESSQLPSGVCWQVMLVTCPPASCPFQDQTASAVSSPAPCCLSDRHTFQQMTRPSLLQLTRKAVSSLVRPQRRPRMTPWWPGSSPTLTNAPSAPSSRHSRMRRSQPPLARMPTSSLSAKALTVVPRCGCSMLFGGSTPPKVGPLSSQTRMSRNPRLSQSGPPQNRTIRSISAVHRGRAGAFRRLGTRMRCSTSLATRSFMVLRLSKCKRRLPGASRSQN
mmetsp:Transcript_17364/g.66141  ORF Transcript_17364/g.66141 Transcript_17364/m.66141 type:complete len:433 (+) Transcript_17364:656-1954(+)